MSKKPKRPSVGERIAGNKRLSNYLISGGRKVLVPLIDAAIRRAVREAYWAGTNDVSDDVLEGMRNMTAKYGVTL